MAAPDPPVDSARVTHKAPDSGMQYWSICVKSSSKFLAFRDLKVIYACRRGRPLPKATGNSRSICAEEGRQRSWDPLGLAQGCAVSTTLRAGDRRGCCTGLNPAMANVRASRRGKRPACSFTASCLPLTVQRM